MPIIRVFPEKDFSDSNNRAASPLWSLVLSSGENALLFHFYGKVSGTHPPPLRRQERPAGGCRRRDAGAGTHGATPISGRLSDVGGAMAPAPDGVVPGPPWRLSGDVVRIEAAILRHENGPWPRGGAH